MAKKKKLKKRIKQLELQMEVVAVLLEKHQKFLEKVTALGCPEERLN
jgi:hypothetical protein